VDTGFLEFDLYRAMRLSQMRSASTLLLSAAGLLSGLPYLHSPWMTNAAQK
jgi:hypothetical protein